MTNLTIYHLRVSQSERAIWACEELGIDYKLECFDRRADNRLAPDAYKEISPTGTAPVITDISKSGKKVVVAESGACVEYIDAVYGDSKLALTKDDPDFASYLFWFHFSNSSLMAMFMSQMALKGSESPLKQVFNARIATYLQLLEDQVKETTWVSGEKFTLADVMMAFPFTTGGYFLPLDLTPYPALQAYVKRIVARPAYQRAMKKGDPELKIKI